MTFDYAALAAAGFSTVKIAYSGSGDEGFINEITPEPFPDDVEFSGPLHDKIEETAYDLLSDHYGGWEINEGSHGDITLIVEQERCVINHGWTVESTKWERKELIR